VDRPVANEITLGPISAPLSSWTTGQIISVNGGYAIP